MKAKKQEKKKAEADSCVLGIDLGTSALKIVAVSCRGHVLATARETYPTISTSQGQAEQSPRDWLRALKLAALDIQAQLESAQIEAIALTGQMPTLIVMNGGKPVGNAITWQDSRADDWVGEKVDEGFRRDVYQKTGVLLDGRYLAPLFCFHHASNRGLILSAKDFLFSILTGFAITDPSTASGYALYNLHTSAWDPEFCRFWGVRREQLPDVESSSFTAPLTPQGSRLLGCRSGTSVVLGCADSVAGAYGITGRGEKEPTVLLTGSSSVILKCDSQPHWDPLQRFLITPMAMDGIYGREADLLASGSALEWVQKLFSLEKQNSESSIWKRVYRVTPGADGLLFSPYLAGGEQGVLWNPTLRGTLTGLTLAHGAHQIVRAMLEGMAFEIRRSLSVLEEGSATSAVAVTGWMADIPEQSQLLADVLGRPVCAFRSGSASAVGAALVSGYVDRRWYLKAIKPIVFRPTAQSKTYNRVYQRYALQFR